MALLNGLSTERHGNAIKCLPFSAESFQRLVLEASGSPTGSAPNTQTKYLARYLEHDLDAAALVVENHYIDRHFIEEVGLYYSRCLAYPPNWCTRVHVFSEALDDRTLDQVLVELATGNPKAAAPLRENYLGYVVVRPLASVPIGRTVLCPPSGDPNRRFQTNIPFRAHLAGIQLDIDAIPFQQQDRAVGACATTAVWTALQRVCRRDGGRAPTPSAITEAAVRHFLPHGRPFPSSGLTIEQICEALRAFGFPPAFFRIRGRVLKALFLLQAYLRSGIPVILALVDPVSREAGHAITVVGYRRADTGREWCKADGLEFRSRNLGFDQLYVHDDRLGPYANAQLQIVSPKDPGDSETLRLKIRFGDEVIDEKEVVCGLAPLYPKLRTTADEVLSASTALAPVMEEHCGWKGAKRELNVFFERSGTYAASLFDTDADPTRIAAFQRDATLSRYVGVAQWSVGGRALIDAVWDTTDTLRPGQYQEQLIGLVARDPALGPLVDSLGSLLGAATG